MAEIREKRKYYEEKPEVVQNILKDGAEKARKEAKNILKEIRSLIKMY